MHKATSLISAVHNFSVVLRSRGIRLAVLWGLCTTQGTQSSRTAQEHEAKKDNPNVRPHLEKDQATVAMGNEHVAPGAGGMHTEVRDPWTCSTSMACSHRASAATDLLKLHEKAAAVVYCTLGDVLPIFEALWQHVLLMK